MSFKQRVQAFLHPAREQKVNPAYQGLITYSTAPQLLQMPRNYKAFAKEGYEDNTVYKCISYISRNGGAIPPKLYTDKTKQREIETHPLLDKLNNPNAEQTGVAYREACLAYKLLTGNNYQYSLRKGSGPPDELWTLRPDLVQILASKPRGIEGYKYEYLEQPILPQNIGHTKYWNPNNEVYGISPIEIAAILIDMQMHTRKWDLALVQNSARPSGAWTTPVPLGKNERNRLEQNLKEKLQGARNAGLPPVLDAGLTWQSMGLPPAELDWLESIKYNAVLLANIYNIPPQLIGDTSSSTYANVDEAKIASYTEAIFPDLDDLYALWNIWLLPMYPDLKGAYLYYDKDSVEVIARAIQMQKIAEGQRAVTAYQWGACTLNQALVLQGLPEDPQGNVYRIGNILVPADSLQEFAQKSLSGPIVPPFQVPERGGTLPNNQTVEAAKPPALPASKPPKKSSKALDLTTLEQKQAHYDAMAGLRGKWQVKAEVEFKKYFASQQKSVVSAVKQAAIPSTAILRVETAIKRSKDEGQKLLSSLYQDVVMDTSTHISAQLQEGEVGHDKKAISSLVGTFGDAVLEYLESLAGSQISQIDSTTLNAVRSALTAGVQAGEDVPTLATRIDSLYLSQITGRAATIAQTEVTAATSYGAIQAAKQSALTLNKVWLAIPGRLTAREDHEEADGQEVGLDDDFEVGGYKMAHPGDPSAPASEVCGCCCTVFFRKVASPEKQAPIPISKRQRRAEYQTYMREALG